MCDADGANSKGVDRNPSVSANMYSYSFTETLAKDGYFDLVRRRGVIR